MRIAIEATPAIAQQGGVGRYTRELLRSLVQETLDHRFVLSASASSAEIDRLLADLPPGAWREVRRLPASDRTMTALWQRLRMPVGIERWIGSHDVFHGVDFTLPPTKAAKVVTIHDLSFLLHPEFSHPKLAGYLQTAVPRAIERADVVITVSASAAADTASAFPAARSKLVAIPNGVRVHDQESLNSSRDQPIVLIVGTIEPRKNHLTLLRAMAEVRAELPEARLVVVGRRGWLADEIVEELEGAQEHGWLTWLSDANDEELERAYREAALFVSPSHYEGFGLPVLEAMARGLPCVVSDIDAHREVAGATAFYGDPADPSSFAAGIVRLLEDADARIELARIGHERAREFSWQETARRTLRAYERAASGPGR